MSIVIAACAAFLTMAAPAQEAKVIHVDADAKGANNGSSWADAFTDLQDALAAAEASQEIRVAEGVYMPAEPNGDREATFQLKNLVKIKGGFAGFGAADGDARDIEAHRTVLSGDLSGTLPEPTRENLGRLIRRGVEDYRNSYHVVTGSGTDKTAVLDGFVVTGGTANGPAFGERAEARYFHGGGVYMESGSPTLTDCKISWNVAFVYAGPSAKGGGMYNLGSSPRLVRCSFVMNWSDDMDSDAYGGGMVNEDSSPTLIDCVFEDNQTYNWGGGIANMKASSLTLKGCRFIRNWGQYGGGAIWSETPEGQVLAASNCVFTGNDAGQPGGAIGASGGRCVLGNCTFVGNRAQHYNGGNAIEYNSWRARQLEAANCIFRDGGDELFCHDRSYVQISFCNVQGGWEGEGNVDVDPCFARAGYWDSNGTAEDFHDNGWVDGDYHLKSQGGRWNANEGRWTIDDVTSPCIDAGDPLGPIGLEPFPNGGIVNMGAYGGTAEASKSYFNKPPCELIVAGDINGDCEIDFRDFFFVALHWLENYNQ